MGHNTKAAHTANNKRVYDPEEPGRAYTVPPSGESACAEKISWRDSMGKHTVSPSSESTDIIRARFFSTRPVATTHWPSIWAFLARDIAWLLHSYKLYSNSFRRCVEIPTSCFDLPL